MEWINTLGGFKKISEDWNTLEPSLRREVSELLLNDNEFKRAMMAKVLLTHQKLKLKNLLILIVTIKNYGNWLVFL